jgi:hypothetical protein
MTVTQCSDSADHQLGSETKPINRNSTHCFEICVHEFTISDVEDPIIHAGEPLLNWQNSEAGQWVMAHAEETPYWIKDLESGSYRYRFRVIARLNDKNQTFFMLKYGPGW